MTLPADTHVHSEWSWDGGSDPASPGRMAAFCRRAEQIGLPGLAFTEHLDFDESWRAAPGDLGPHAHRVIGDDGLAHIPPLDVPGYLEAIDRSRRAHPDLRVLTGVELGQPHVWSDRVAPLLTSGAIERVNGSLHTLPDGGGGRAEPITLYRQRPADDVMEAYLAELAVMAAHPGRFEVVAHIDYAARTWPVERAGPFDPLRFEEGFRAALRAIARSGRALELNTKGLAAWIPRWWVEEGGRAVSFGSDAHEPDRLAAGFAEAAVMAESFGFAPGRHPEDLWTRR